MDSPCESAVFLYKTAIHCSPYSNHLNLLYPTYYAHKARYEENYCLRFEATSTIAVSINSLLTVKAGAAAAASPTIMVFIVLA